LVTVPCLLQFWGGTSSPPPVADIADALVFSLWCSLQAIKNILLAWTMYEPEVGYVQGMTYIIVLIYVTVVVKSKVKHDEGDCFAFFVQLMNNYDLRTLSAPAASISAVVSFLTPHPLVDTTHNIDMIPSPRLSTATFRSLTSSFGTSCPISASTL